MNRKDVRHIERVKWKGHQTMSITVVLLDLDKCAHCQSPIVPRVLDGETVWTHAEAGYFTCALNAFMRDRAQGQPLDWTQYQQDLRMSIAEPAEQLVDELPDTCPECRRPF